jgi:hypothetical protein
MHYVPFITKAMLAFTAHVAEQFNLFVSVTDIWKLTYNIQFIGIHVFNLTNLEDQLY